MSTTDDLVEEVDAPVPTEPSRASRTARRRRRRRRRIILGIIALWLVWAGYSMWTAKSDADAGIAALQAARDGMNPAALVRGARAKDLEAARTAFSSAHDDLDSWSLAPIRILPVLGRQLSSTRALSAAATEVTDAGLDAIDQFKATLSGDQSSGPARVQLTRDVQRIAKATRARIDEVDLGPSEALLGPLARGRDRFVAERDNLVAQLDDVMLGAAGMQTFLTGPTHYLMLAANNGEMRAGSGMFLSAGVLDVNDGTLQASDLSTTVDLRLPPGAVQVTGDLGDRWGWTGPGEEWRNLAMTPRFDATAELASRMWTAKTGQKVDGVVAIDPVALKAILAATGPVDVDGTQITADNVIDYLLVEQYRGIDTSDYTSLAPATRARRERLSAIAHAVLDRLQAGSWDTSTLLEGMSSAAKGRHVLMWSSVPSQVEAWRAVGLTGELNADSMALSLLSQGGTKIDQFLDVTSRVTRSDHDMTVAVTIRNQTPEGLPPYVQGPTYGASPTMGVPEGTYAGIVTLDVPASTTQLSIDGVSAPLVGGRDGPALMIGTRVTLARGAETTLVFRATLPGGTPIEISPTGRSNPVHWLAGKLEWWDTETYTLNG